jgi:eukaryotic-like serine/threonine-protein kinase
VRLTAGTRLGPYVIVAPIGAGGMGEVYRAQDERLRREVAVKILPEAVATDAERLRRFQLEARAAAALNHPNLLAVYDLGTHEEIPFIVSELLDGETLRDRLRSDSLPVNKAVEIAAALARGLAAAHAKGIVHRDLKPENVFLTRDGRVKILDFGLAKLIQLEDQATQIAGTPSVTTTRPGIVLGTVGYMSPEQLRGQPGDHRSDLFALGAVCYEMLCGRRAFASDSAVDTMAAILREEPAEMATGSVPVPPALERLVRQCLEKRPEERIQSAQDLAFALELLGGGIGTGMSTAALPALVPSRRRRWPWAVAGVLIAAAIAVEAGRRLGNQRPRGAAVAVTHRPLTEAPGAEAGPSLSPDGRSFLFVGGPIDNTDVFLQRTDGRNPIVLTADSPGNDWAPAFSPDGTRIAFRSERDGGGIFLMGATGESTRRVSDFGHNPCWSPDGQNIAVDTAGPASPVVRQGNSELWTIHVESGERRRVHSGDAVQPSWSPNGRRIAFWGSRAGNGHRDLWTVVADGSGAEAIPVTDDAAIDWRPLWAADGKSLYFLSDRGGTMNLWRVALHLDSGKVLGEPRAVTVPAAALTGFAISADGSRLAYATAEVRTSVLVAGFDSARGALADAPRPAVQFSRPLRTLDSSPDGQWLAYTTSDAAEDLFLVRADGSGGRQLTDDAWRDRAPEFSRDGSRIAFHSNRSGQYQIWTIHPDGSGLAQLSHAPPPGYFILAHWSPDGQTLAVQDVTNSYLLDAESGALLRKLPPIPTGQRFAAYDWSPDGQLLLGGGAHAEADDEPALLTYSLATGTHTSLPGRAADAEWLRDGRRALLLSARGLDLLDTRTGVLRSVVAAGAAGVSFRDLALAADDRTVAWLEERRDGDIWLLEGAPP